MYRKMQISSRTAEPDQGLNCDSETNGDGSFYLDSQESTCVSTKLFQL